MTDLVLHYDSYQRVLGELIPMAQRYLWILTADIKDLHLPGPGGRFIPLLEVLAQRLEEGIEIRLVHAKEPGPRFRTDFDRFPAFLESPHFDRVLCPRMHMKAVIADGKRAYIGSANLTGAGLGTKSMNKRNFEAGVVTDEPQLLAGLLEFCDSFYTGSLCRNCALRSVCPNPVA
jgi:phosphatidylserine/phosphatidylglycerophosphate/cardiolipin synthase-like enzyme